MKQSSSQILNQSQIKKKLSKNTDTNQFKISAFLIVLNEEKYIEHCLQNLTGKVDEIIVVDGESTDNTVSICKKYQTKVISKKFEFNFRDQRNFAIQHCRYKWVLMIDADEYFDEIFYQYLPQLIKQKKYDAFSVTRYNKYLEHIKNPIYRWYKLKKAGLESQIRLFQSHCYCTGGMIHEYITGYRNLGQSEGLLIHDKSLKRQKYSNRIYGFLRKNQKPEIKSQKYNVQTREIE